MAGPWDIKLPPPPPVQPLHPVRPGAAIKDRDDNARRRRDQDPEQKREPPRDDGQTHIDDYA